MAQFDREPPNGDYAAYVKKLNANPAPGAVDAPARKPRKKRPVKVVRHDYNSHTEFEYVAEDPDKAPDTLGPRGSRRLLGRVQMGLGLLTLFVLANVLIGMMASDEPFAPERLVPAIILGVIARMFLTRGRAALRKPDTPPPR